MSESERNKLAIAEAMKRLMRETPIEKITPTGSWRTRA